MTRYIVRVNQGLNGWKTLKTFDNPGDADRWLTNHIKTNNYIPSDFTIVRK